MKLQLMDDRVASGSAMQVARFPKDAPPFTPDGAPRDTVQIATLEIHGFRLATQDIRVAYDPHSETLFVGETNAGGWVRRVAEKALHEQGPGGRNPFFREVWDAEMRAGFANESAHAARSAREAHAKHVAEATERLKSRKPGVRRRAKRLLERLGR